MPAATIGVPAQGTGPKQGAAPAMLVPFTRAAVEHIEVFVDVAQQLGTSGVQLGPYDVPAYGFMRGIYLNITATGGVGGGATVAAAEDAPFSVIDELAILDVNGAPIVGPLSGYDLYLINKYGGLAAHSPDPKQKGTYSGVAAGAGATGNFAFQLRIPIEVNGRDALGALANQNAASTYKLRLTLAPASKLYTTAPATTLPSVRVRASLDAWTQPTPSDLRGNGQATQPPAHGTTSYWSKTTFTLGAGFQNVRLPRVGNYLRELVFILRDANGSRLNGEAAFPDPLAIYWDTRLLKSYLKDLWINQHAERFDVTNAIETARGRDRGVFVEDYCHEFWGGAVGTELRDGWLPTVQSTRLEVQGTFGSAVSLTVLTNDVAPAGEIFV